MCERFALLSASGFFRSHARSTMITIPCFVVVHGERVPAVYTEAIKAQKHAALLKAVVFHGTCRLGKRYEPPTRKSPSKSKR